VPISNEELTQALKFFKEHPGLAYSLYVQAVKGDIKGQERVLDRIVRTSLEAGIELKI
jgi:hypothetical protein